MQQSGRGIPSAMTAAGRRVWAMQSRSSSIIEVQLQVLSALILRDIRTRFGRTMWGYSIAVMWPCAHIVVLFTLMAIRHMPTPLGDSLVLFILTGVTPFIVFQYMSRKIMECIGTGRPLIYFPQVKVLDLLMSRMVVEFCTACMSILLAFLIVFSLGIDATPVDPYQAALAFLASILFAIGIGVINANIATVFPPYQIGFVLVIILLYGLSGVFYLPEGLPQVLYDAIAWNPMMQLIVWFRSAFYAGYGESVARSYVVLLSGALIVIGLLWERFLTKRFLT
ncbi:ABC transporter permease [Methylobacterium crusticola]|uniref:ABC transporter permease n=1 Tax=Methylobacterium crusticola TaxID=1697972 RepID=UPI001EE2A79F|nr:ABC transporter permease [Methylobacterium crusticola]